jgi:hypothetical protein
MILVKRLVVILVKRPILTLVKRPILTLVKRLMLTLAKRPITALESQPRLRNPESPLVRKPALTSTSLLLRTATRPQSKKHVILLVIPPTGMSLASTTTNVVTVTHTLAPAVALTNPAKSPRRSIAGIANS